MNLPFTLLPHSDRTTFHRFRATSGAVLNKEDLPPSPFKIFLEADFYFSVLGQEFNLIYLHFFSKCKFRYKIARSCLIKHINCNFFSVLTGTWIFYWKTDYAYSFLIDGQTLSQLSKLLEKVLQDGDFLPWNRLTDLNQEKEHDAQQLKPWGSRSSWKWLFFLKKKSACERVTWKNIGEHAGYKKNQSGLLLIFQLLLQCCQFWFIFSNAIRLICGPPTALRSLLDTPHRQVWRHPWLCRSCGDLPSGARPRSVECRNSMQQT